MATSRIDFEIGEDADYIVIADASSQSELQSARDMIAAGLKNEAFVLPLPEDGGISGRVVFDALNDDELDNWVARADRPLQVRTPKIVFDAGDFFGRELGIELGMHNNHLVVEIEPGNYVLTCLVYLTSDIATDLFKRHKFSYLELFLKSHPNRKIPSWLIEEAECRDNEADEEWCETIDDDRIDHESSDRFVDILFHFQKDAVVETPTSVSKTGKLK